MRHLAEQFEFRFTPPPLPMTLLDLRIQLDGLQNMVKLMAGRAHRDRNRKASRALEKLLKTIEGIEEEIRQCEEEPI